MKNKTEIWDRLLEVLNADNLDETAKKLGINASTLRGRKARGAIPYENIVQKLDSKDLIYVLKNEKITSVGNSFDPPDEPTLLQEIDDLDEIRYDSAESIFENFLIGLIQKIETAPFSKAAKLKLIDSVIRIVELDIKINHEHNHSSDSHLSRND